MKYQTARDDVVLATKETPIERLSVYIVLMSFPIQE